LAAEIAHLCGYEGDIRWDPSKPNGQPRRWIDASGAREHFGWQATTPLADGLRRTLEWYRAQVPVS